MTSTGDAGGIEIQAPSLLIQNGAQVAVSSDGSGQAGAIDLDSEFLALDQGSISARAKGNGGNIFINAPVLVALPNTNSDITAEAIEGMGGEISIQTLGLFGIAVREQLPVTNDITASSEVGLDGLVEVETSDVDRTDNLVKLPASLLNITLTRGCQPKGQSKFVDSRQGGYALSPAEIGILSSSSWEDLRLRRSNSPVPEKASTSHRTSSPSELSLVEAQGWSAKPNGQIALVAETSEITASSITQAPVICRS